MADAQEFSAPRMCNEFQTSAIVSHWMCMSKFLYQTLNSNVLYHIRLLWSRFKILPFIFCIFICISYLFLVVVSPLWWCWWFADISVISIDISMVVCCEWWQYDILIMLFFFWMVKIFYFFLSRNKVKTKRNDIIIWFYFMFVTNIGLI